MIDGQDRQHRDRMARAVLTWIAEPGDAQLVAVLRRTSPATVVAALTTGSALGTAPAGRGLDRARQRWTARLGDAPTGATVEAWERDGIRLVCPGDPEWPSQLEVLGDAQPWGLWVRGQVDLRFACLHSVSIVGTRAATAYGIHVTAELAAALAGRGWTVVSGGAFGIDSQAHRGALAAEGATVAVLPSGLDAPYPRSHHNLFEAIVAHGALVSEQPPSRTPTRPGFLVRNRLIAALSRGTVLVEAALRSGALNTARHARDLNRPLMAVPGPVTSMASAGCHQVIRDWGGVCVTDVHDILACLSFSPGDMAALSRGPVLPRDELDPVSLSVLEAVPARVGRGPARIAVSAGVDFDTVLRCLGKLAAGGFIERCERGWRIRRPDDPVRVSGPPISQILPDSGHVRCYPAQ
ncbi:MAG: DNA-processing protein DprA [Streptosporangiaceae bacterium]|jgi:DNA processing protein